MQTKHMSTNDLEVFPDHRGSGQYSNTVRKSLQLPFESYPAFLPVTKLCLLYYAFMWIIARVLSVYNTLFCYTTRTHSEDSGCKFSWNIINPCRRELVVLSDKMITKSWHIELFWCSSLSLSHMSQSNMRLASCDLANSLWNLWQLIDNTTMKLMSLWKLITIYIHYYSETYVTCLSNYKTCAFHCLTFDLFIIQLLNLFLYNKNYDLTILQNLQLVYFTAKHSH